jgi:hypothetical protein
VTSIAGGFFLHNSHLSNKHCKFAILKGREKREKIGKGERTGGDAGGTPPDPTDQRHGLFFGDHQALLQQPRQQQPPQPRPRPAMHPQQQQQQRGALPPTQAFIGAGMPPPPLPPQGAGGLGSMAAAQAKAEAAARARAAEQMALEDAWKALNPDFRTPFASVEDAVSRCVRACARVRSSSPPPIGVLRLARRAGSLSCSRDLLSARPSSCLHLSSDMFARGFWD